MRIMMVAAENGALPGGKVGGVADVVRELPIALARQGVKVDVITPGYQHFSRLSGAEFELSLSVLFAGRLEQVSLFRLPASAPDSDVAHWCLEHPLFAACGEGQIYCHDANEPFATDAHKFALFCASVCQLLISGGLPLPDYLHLHDWHTAMCLFLRQFDSAYHGLRSIPAVYTIHNLGIQGLRPLRGGESSLASWFPRITADQERLRDPVHDDCVNLMRLAINLADQVHVVSPSYALEVLRPSVPEQGFIGGEGLEADLAQVAAEGRLHGILNGCEYPVGAGLMKPSKAAFLAQCQESLHVWVGEKQHISAAYFHAQEHLFNWSRQRRKDSIVVAAIGRLVAQKVGLLLAPAADGRPALETLLELMPKGMLVMLGSGDAQTELRMMDIMRRHDNFLFLCGFSEALAEQLYAFCDAFLMPSTYEPCGISQMLALRAGKPCLVNRVGGLADTVTEDNGFVFSGDTVAAQVQALITAFGAMLEERQHDTVSWQARCRAARKARFSWDDSVRAYLAQLYVAVPQSKGGR